MDVEIENLLRSVCVGDTYANDVFFGYDAANARVAIRRLASDEPVDVSHRGLS